MKGIVEMKNNTFKHYERVMNQVDISPEAKQRIAHHCARYATLAKIKPGKFTVTAVIKDKSSDRA